MLEVILTHVENKNIDAFKELVPSCFDLTSVQMADRKYIVHYAADAGCIEIMQHILEQDSSYLELTDRAGKTPLMTAAMAGHTQLVEYLLRAGANAFHSLDINYIGKPDVTALYLANSNAKYAAANILLQHMLNDDNKDNILDFIRHPIEAVEYMLLSERISRLILDNPRLRSLLEKGSRLANNRVSFYKPKARRQSFYYELDLETGQAFKFSKNDVIGQGGNGVVYDFFCGSQRRAVKYFDEIWLEHEERVIDAQYEFKNRDLVYPGVNSFFYFSRRGRNESRVFDEYTVRDVTELIPGEILLSYIRKVTSTYQIAEIYLLIVQELLRVQTQVVHGDVKENNIMVYSENGELKVKFIDFGCSSKLTDLEADTYEGKKVAYMAPERFHRHFKPIIDPNTNQDVYSLGYMFDKLLKILQPNFREEICRYFPCIDNFMREAVRINATKRPKLQPFAEAFIVEYRSYLENRQVVVMRPVMEPESLGVCSL